MASIPLKPLSSVHLHLRRNPILPSTMPADSPAVYASGLIRSAFRGVQMSTNYRTFESVMRRSVMTSRRHGGVVKSTVLATVAVPPWWESWKPEKTAASPSMSDVIWPAAGAFAAMAVLGRMDQMLSAKGVSISIAPLGAVSTILFTTPSAPGARKYNMFMAQIGCAAIGVLALSMFGPGWLARSTALAASIAFMVLTRAVHPPAASLPLMFIDGTKFHHLNFWYALFPGAAGCIVLCFIQEMVSYLKRNMKF